MAWLDAVGDAITAGPSPAESGVLAPDVWHLWVGQAAPDDPHAVGRCLRSAAGADLVIARFASGQAWVGAVLAASGRAVIPAGGIVYWQCTRPVHPVAPHDSGAGLRALGPDDAGRCAAIVSETFAGYTNHYSANPRLHGVSVAHAYADWAVRALGQAGCDVTEWRGADGDAEGLAVTRRVDDTVEILLAGMRPAFRGRGAYPALFTAIVNNAFAQGASRVVISTQDHNVQVQRIWGRCGLTPTLAVTVVHLVAESTA